MSFYIAEKTEEFENQHHVKVNYLLHDEIEEKYGIEESEIENHVINFEGQTLPLELLVIEDKGKPYIFHAKQPYQIEETFLNLRNE